MTGSEPSGELSSPRRIHIDTDPGLDDLLALALAFASPEVRVVGISTVAGNAGVDAVTENAQRFTALAGVDVPIGRGAAGPLELEPVTAEHIHGADGRDGILIPAVDRRQVPDALEVLRQSLAERQAKTVVALGPLTNIASLIRTAPSLLEGVEIVWMGGTLSVGNVTAVAEFNCYADPAAAELVLSSGFPMRVIGLDVTSSVQLRARDLPAMAFGESPMGKLMTAVTHALMRAEVPLAGEPVALLHDPAAVVASFAPDFFRYDHKALSVVVDEGHERGRLRETAEAGAPGIRYAVEVRDADLRQLFLERVSAWAEVRRG